MDPGEAGQDSQEVMDSKDQPGICDGVGETSVCPSPDVSVSPHIHVPLYVTQAARRGLGKGLLPSPLLAKSSKFERPCLQSQDSRKYCNGKPLGASQKNWQDHTFWCY